MDSELADRVKPTSGVKNTYLYMKICYGFVLKFLLFCSLTLLELTRGGKLGVIFGHSTLLSLPQLFPYLVQGVALLGSVKTPLPSHRCHNIKLKRNLSPSQNYIKFDKESTCHSIPAFFPVSGQLSPLASHNCWSKRVGKETPVIICSSTQPQASRTV